MKTEGIIIQAPEAVSAGGGILGTHQFLDEFALAYHRAVAERLRERPGEVLTHARRNLDRWTRGGAFGPGEASSLEEWREILDRSGVGRLIEIITEDSEEGQRLRQSSPFAGAIPPDERREILAACEQRATV
jgi:hypothetical protein